MINPLNPIEQSRVLLGGIGRSKLYELVRENKLTLVKIGRRSMITGESIIRLTSAGAA